jgi:cellobiose-specific phosphotransferase system component IIC
MLLLGIDFETTGVDPKTSEIMLIIFALIIGYGFWQKYKEQKEAQNASILTFKMTAPEGENRVQIETKLCVSKNVPEWGNGLLVKSRDLISHVFRKETE